jgi:hypothetical protein
VASGYSVLTHEAIIDAAWNDSIRPLLLKRFPNSTPDELRKAHAYAYGGAIVQDMGYYPFGNKLFSDLVHYVRPGDFIVRLIEDARTLDEYAFALGSLAHAAADIEGHSIATNHAVAVLYPKLKSKYGDPITYEKNPAAHLKVEFGFDVSQVAKGNFAPEAYHDFIGFEVAKDLLDRAFLATYSIEFDSLFASTDLSLGTFRYSIGSVIPLMTKVAWETRRDEIVAASPGITEQRFRYNLSRAAYHKEWGDKYERPGFFARFLAVILRVMPKIGLFRPLEFQPLTPEVEKLFARSFNATLDRYRALLKDPRSVPNLNFDTGKAVELGAYGLCDKAHARLLDKLAEEKFKGVSEPVRAHLLAFYGNSPVPAKVQAQLRSLKDATIVGKEKAK